MTAFTDPDYDQPLAMLRHSKRPGFQYSLENPEFWLKFCLEFVKNWHVLPLEKRRHIFHGEKIDPIACREGLDDSGVVPEQFAPRIILRLMDVGGRKCLARGAANYTDWFQPAGIVFPIGSGYPLDLL